MCKNIIGERINIFDLQYTTNYLNDELIKINRNENIEDLNLFYEIDGNELIVEGGKFQTNFNNVEDYIDKELIMKFKNIKIKLYY